MSKTKQVLAAMTAIAATTGVDLPSFPAREPYRRKLTKTDFDALAKAEEKRQRRAQRNLGRKK